MSLCEGVCGLVLGSVGVIATGWAIAFPFVSALAALLGLALVVHGVARVVWRWAHGYPNFLSDHEVESEIRKCIQARGPCEHIAGRSRCRICGKRPGDPAVPVGRQGSRSSGGNVGGSVYEFPEEGS